MKILYRVYLVEWMHNGNWRMDEDSRGARFTTKSAAEAHQKTIKDKSPNLQTRIVKVEVMQHLSNEDAENRIRERIVDAMVLTGKPELAVHVLWQSVNAYLGVPSTLHLSEVL